MTNPDPAADTAFGAPGLERWTLPEIPVNPQELVASLASEAEDIAQIAGTLRTPGPEATAAGQLRRDLLGAYFSLSLIAANAAAVIEHTQASPGTGYALRNLLTACDNAQLTAEVLTGALEAPPATPEATAALRAFAAHPLDQAVGHMLLAVGHLLPPPDTAPTGPAAH